MNKLRILVENMATAVLDFPEDLKITYTSMATSSIKFNVTCRDSDLPHLIGRHGILVRSMRSILHAAGTKDDIKTYLSVD